VPHRRTPEHYRTSRLSHSHMFPSPSQNPLERPAIAHQQDTSPRCVARRRDRRPATADSKAPRRQPRTPNQAYTRAPHRYRWRTQPLPIPRRDESSQLRCTRNLIRYGWLAASPYAQRLGAAPLGCCTSVYTPQRDPTAAHKYRCMAPPRINGPKSTRVNARSSSACRLRSSSRQTCRAPLVRSLSTPAARRR